MKEGSELDAGKGVDVSDVWLRKGDGSALDACHGRSVSTSRLYLRQ